jgi:hypothetical protein
MRLPNQSLGLLAVAVALSAGSTASAIPILSGDGTEACRKVPFASGTGANCSAQVVTPDPIWQDGVNGAKWISFADTGFRGSVVALPPTDNNAAPDYSNTVMQIREDFDVIAGDRLWLDVWSAGTVDVQLRTIGSDFSGGFVATLLSPDFRYAEAGSCVATHPGCGPGSRGAIDYVFETAGRFSVLFSVFSFNTADNGRSDPFGLLYRGAIGEGCRP